MKEVEENKEPLINKDNNKNNSNLFENDDKNCKISRSNILKNLKNLDFTKGYLEQHAKKENIKNLDKNILNNIDKSILSKLSDNVFKQITKDQFKTAEMNVILNLVKLRKIHNLNDSILKIFFKKYFNSIQDIDDIKDLLSIIGKKRKYLTTDNFIHLGKFVGTTDKLDVFYEMLIKKRFFDEEEITYSSYQPGILDKKEFSNDETIEHDKIKENILNLLNDGESYELLKDYCIKCRDKEDDKQLSIQILSDILNESSYNIFKKIDQYRILEILIICDENEENQAKKYNRLKKLIKEINDLELFDPCEFYAKINFFSKIIKERFFDDDFLEIIAEENLRNIKYLFKTFYSGTDKNAIPENLRNLHVQIIKDYKKIVKKKYNIDKKKIIDGLKKIAEDKDNLENKLIIFLKNLTAPEKLYYDLTIQSVIEMPSLSKNVEEKCTVFMKFIRDIGLTTLAVKCASCIFNWLKNTNFNKYWNRSC